jgi:hypothetical protein
MIETASELRPVDSPARSSVGYAMAASVFTYQNN